MITKIKPREKTLVKERLSKKEREALQKRTFVEPPSINWIRSEKPTKKEVEKECDICGDTYHYSELKKTALGNVCPPCLKKGLESEEDTLYTESLDNELIDTSKIIEELEKKSFTIELSEDDNNQDLEIIDDNEEDEFAYEKQFRFLARVTYPGNSLERPYNEFDRFESIEDALYYINDGIEHSYEFSIEEDTSGDGYSFDTIVMGKKQNGRWMLTGEYFNEFDIKNGELVWYENLSSIDEAVATLTKHLKVDTGEPLEPLAQNKDWEVYKVYDELSLKKLSRISKYSGLSIPMFAEKYIKEFKLGKTFYLFVKKQNREEIRIIVDKNNKTELIKLMDEGITFSVINPNEFNFPHIDGLSYQITEEVKEQFSKNRTKEKLIETKEINRRKERNKGEQKMISKLQSRRINEAVDSARVVAENDEWEIFSIETKEQAISLGNGTNWDIASSEQNRYFDRYVGRGDKFYFAISKTNPRNKLAILVNSDGRAIRVLDRNDNTVSSSKLGELNLPRTSKISFGSVSNESFRRNNEAVESARVVAENDEWKIHSIETPEKAKILGSSNWDISDSMYFNRYTKNGEKLYFALSKKNPKNKIAILVSGSGELKMSFDENNNELSKLDIGELNLPRTSKISFGRKKEESYKRNRKLVKESYGNEEEIWDTIIEFGIATQEELELITSINGYNKDTLDDVIYARTGYRSIEQFLGENEDYEEDEEEEENE